MAAPIGSEYTYSGYKYILISPGTRDECQNSADADWGGNLAKVEDAATNSWIISTFGGTNMSLWIGLHSLDAGVSYIWEEDGSGIGAYAPWAPKFAGDGTVLAGGDEPNYPPPAPVPPAVVETAVFIIPADVTDGSKSLGGYWNNYLTGYNTYAPLANPTIREAYYTCAINGPTSEVVFEGGVYRFRYGPFDSYGVARKPV